MTNTNVKLTKADYASFLESVATIKAKKRTKLFKLTELASTLLDDYNEDQKGTSLVELEEMTGKVLLQGAELPQEQYEQLKTMWDALILEASLRKPVKETKKKITKKKEEEKEEVKEEAPVTNTIQATLTTTLQIENADGTTSTYEPISFDSMEAMNTYFEEGETYDLHVLSYWGNDFDKDDYDALGILGEDEVLLNKGYDLMSIVHVGKKTAIAVSIYNDVNTTLTEEDLHTLLEQDMGLFKKIEEDEEEEE